MLRQVALPVALVAMSCLFTGCTGRASSSATGFEELDLKPVGAPDDEPVEDTLQRRFSRENALQRMEQIESALASFQRLTETVKAAAPDTKLDKIGNLDWETQNLGFGNWSGAVKGTLLKQQYMIAQLQYELSRERWRRNKTSKAEMTQTRQEYEQAKQAFQEFWNSFSIAD
jgi:hypothetical protein